MSVTKTKRKTGIRKAPQRSRRNSIGTTRTKIHGSNRKKTYALLGRPDSSALKNSNFHNEKTVIEVVNQMDDHPILSNCPDSVALLENVLDGLTKHPHWKDHHHWDEHTTNQELIDTLVKDLILLKPEYGDFKLNADLKKIFLYATYPHHTCFIDASNFVLQIKDHHPQLFEILAPTLGKLNTVLKMDLWHSELEDQALEYIGYSIEDPESCGWDEDPDTLKEAKNEISFWQEVLIPLQKECVKKGRLISNQQLEDKIKSFPWPTSFCARRIYLWFIKALKMIKHGKSLCHAVEYDPDEYHDGPPLDPYNCFRFIWGNNHVTAKTTHISEEVNSYFDDRAGNFGILELQEEIDITKSWQSQNGWMEDLNSFLDASISIWQFPEYRDWYQFTNVHTKSEQRKNYRGQPYIAFLPISYNPKDLNNESN